MKFSACTTAAFLACMIAEASAAPVLLTVDPSSASTTTVSTASGKAVRQTVFSGQVPAEIVLHPLTRKPQGFRFEGGTLFYSDATSVYTPNVPPAVEDLAFTSTGLSGPITSLPGLPAVDPVTGRLGNLDHFQTISTGTLRSVYQLFFGAWFTIYDETIDFTTTPETNPVSGTTILTAELLAGGPLLERHRVVLAHASDETPVVFMESGVSLTSVTTGGFTARGEALVPAAAFHTWMVAAGAAEPISINTKLGAWPGSILYALGLPEDARNLPLVMNAQAGTVTLTLPAGGTRVPLQVEYSGALSGWQALTLPGGGTLLPAGTSGPVVVSLPAGPRGFVRLAVSATP